MNYTCTATKVWSATNINALKSHATADQKHPLCSDKLNVVTWDGEADARYLSCKRCVKKMETA